MTRLDALTSALLALLASLALAACGGTVDFSVDKLLDVDTNVNSGHALAGYDLAASAGSAWKQRSHISSVSITEADATVTAVGAGNAATTVSGAVWLLPEGATSTSDAGAVPVGDWTGQPVEVGTTISLQLSQELNDFVRNAFKGSGKFSVYTEGTGASGARVVCTLHVVLGGRLKWKAF